MKISYDAMRSHITLMGWSLSEVSGVPLMWHPNKGPCVVVGQIARRFKNKTKWIKRGQLSSMPYNASQEARYVTYADGQAFYRYGVAAGAV